MSHILGYKGPSTGRHNAKSACVSGLYGLGLRVFKVSRARGLDLGWLRHVFRVSQGFRGLWGSESILSGVPASKRARACGCEAP